MADIRFEVDDNKTYCQYTKQTAVFIGMPLLLFFIIIAELLFVTLFFSFGTFLLVVAFQTWILYILKKKKIRLSNINKYRRARRARIKTAIPKYRRYNRKKQEKIAKDIFK